jgi:hypothetical protein
MLMEDVINVNHISIYITRSVIKTTKDVHYNHLLIHVQNVNQDIKSQTVYVKSKSRH